MVNRLTAITVAVFASWSGQTAALGAGTETIGAEPLGEANYADRPGIMPVINDPHRVYHSWVNGNEHFYYRGDTAAVNEALKRFAAIGEEPREVVLRPGPGEAKRFQGEAVAHDWMLHLVGGIAGHMATLDKGERVWPKHPVLHVYVGESVRLDELEIPEGVKALGLKELKARHREALESKDQTIRGWSAGALAELDAFDESSAATIALLLKDEKDWVRLNAAHALARFGPRAKEALPALREALDTTDKPLKGQVEKAIDEIEGPAADEEAAERQTKALGEIEEFLEERE